VSGTGEVGIIGATGLLGRAVAGRLAEMGYRVLGYSRGGEWEVPGVAAWRDSAALDFGGLDVLINFAGRRVDCRWTAENRQEIADSRAGFSGRVVDALARLEPEARPGLLINGSATGYYGDGGDRVLDESSGPGDDFLAGICCDWEMAASRAETLGVRVMRLRTGVVLGRGASAFRRLKRMFQMGLGGRLGDGGQWMPWIHLDDFASAVGHLVRTDGVCGACNLCAPNPVTNAEFTIKLADALHRPAVLPVPGWVLKVVMGGFGGALLGGQRAVPVVLERSGFVFRFARLEDALADLCAGAGSA